MRVTDAETMEIVEWVLAGQVQQELVMLINGSAGRLSAHGQRRRPDSRRAGCACPRDDPSLTTIWTGRRDRGDRSVAGGGRCRRRVHPVISPIGSARRPSDNINADLVAGKIAEILCAEKLCC